jgi:two-component system KDP operon response regulator KdpE
MLGQVVLLVVEEPQLRRLLRVTLNHQGAKLVEFRRATDALEPLEAHRPDLVFLDVRMPDAGAMEATRLLRQCTDAPIIAFSDTNEERRKVAVFDAGADDYLTVPFSNPEMLARSRAALRRALRSRAQERCTSFRVGALEVDFVARDVRVLGKSVHLTPTEYKLLGVLLESAGKIVTHQRLLEEVWGPSFVERVQYLRVYIMQLRRKLEPPSLPHYLVTEPAVGYRFRLPG